MNQIKTIVLVLRTGKDFGYQDVELIVKHILGKWRSEVRPRIICLYDKVSREYDLGQITLIPITNNWPGTWARMQLYSPEMEKYRPFLYVDLDTAVIRSLENIFSLVKDPTQFICLEDFWQKGQLATGVVWFPANSLKIQNVWRNWKDNPTGSRMDYFLRTVLKPDLYWQQLTDTIIDFKEKGGKLLTKIPENTNLVCFHGKPRIFMAGQGSMKIDWVHDYIHQEFSKRKLVTVIIPYNVDRGWLEDAVMSVPEEAQLILSQGPGNWPENFNKALPLVEGKYVRWLHEDDMLTPNCIDDSLRTFDELDVDFIHGKAIEIIQATGVARVWSPPVIVPTFENLLHKNTIHSATLMYKREVFEKVGKMDETLNTAEEFEFNLRCLKAGLKLGYCSSELAYYRRHPKQKVRVVPTSERTKEREMVKNKYK